MTATPADRVDRVTRVSDRRPRALSSLSALAILLLAGLALRFTIAYILFPGSGFESDLASFSSWARTMAEFGPGGFYANAGFADYPPGYLYVLWAVGGLAGLLAPLAGGAPDALVGTLIKLPPMLADVALAALLYRIVSRWSSEPGQNASRLGMLAAGAYLINPVTWYDSALWGQADAVGALVMLLGVAALLRGNPEGSAALAVKAGLIKPQFGVVLAPIVVVVLLRRHLLAPGSGPVRSPWLPAGLADRAKRTQGPIRLVTSALAGLVVLLLAITPFGLDIPAYLQLMARAAGGYEWLTVNAYNPWALVGADGTPPLASSGTWSSDIVPFLGPLPGVLIGTLLLAGGFIIGLGRLLQRADRWSIVLVTIFLSLCFFVLPTRVHERYLFPAFAFLPLLAAAQGKWRWATVALALGSFMNLHAILTVDIYGTETVVGLPLGDLFRSYPGVLVSVLLQTAAFAFVVWQLRPSAMRQPDPLTRAASEGRTSPWRPASGVAATPASGNSPAALSGSGGGTALQPSSPASAVIRDAEPPGVLDRIADHLRVRPLRADRSGELHGEPPGRFDRLDLLLVVLLVLGTLSVRTYRLDEPYDMHFDEVYHARTATEFLQDWRYGMGHSIYEYTHPHLAKYGIALGLLAFGNDRVTATAELGAATSDALVEPRWSPSGLPAERNGDRLFVATDTEVRVYDLRDRSLVASLPAAARQLAIDPTSHTLYLAGEGEGVSYVATGDLDLTRRDPSRPVPAPTILASLEGQPSAVEGLAAIDGRLIVSLAGGTLLSLDGLTGEETGQGVVDGATDVLGVPAAERVVADPALIDDRAAVAERLAEVLGDDAGALEAGLLAATDPLTLAAYPDEATRTDLQAAIDEGALPGVTIESGPAIAVAGAGGVTFLDAASLEPLETVTLDGAVRGMVLVDGLDDPTLYAADGDQLKTILMADGGPRAGSDVPMPGPISQVLYDEATNLVHAVGLTPDGEDHTAYVVEPHGNAVFADARLPFEPVASMMDVQEDRPADDRQALLALSADGSMVSVDVGSHAFAWRLPGVLMGALTAAALYFLTRTLFRRRSVAVLAAGLVMVESMFFANARIAMNDTYVTGFIVAALAVFAPLYLGIWRGRLAVLLGLPLVGLLLGLALASKWAGAYAIGLVLLLILLRSAMGRIIALLGMIGLTGLLGFLAIRAPVDVVDPGLNFMFLILMVALTALLATAMVRRPVRFSLDELRFAVIAPGVVGALLVLAGLLVGPTRPLGGAGLLTPNGLLAAGAGMLFLGVAAYASSWLGGRLGIGPLAPVRRRDPFDPVPSPAPTGWLRPGWFGGIPWLFALASVAALPLLVYIASYVPWALLNDPISNRLIDSWPPGNTGQTLQELTVNMYEYHDDLRASHAASSPFWAWPFDLKPVWFYQQGFANSTTGVIYDTGNLVIFWLGIPAVAFCAWQAWARRSLPLALVVLSVACLWLPWARIDRATFQYHVFTSLPFTVIALAYFLAELWHGASSRTFLLARAAGALAILGPPLLWLFRMPLCAAAGTAEVHPDGVACGPLTRSVTVADSVLVALLVLIAGAAAVAWVARMQMRHPGRRTLMEVSLGGRVLAVSSLGLMMAIALLAAAGAALAQLLFRGAPLTTLSFQAEELALLALILLAGPAYLALRARDPRRWVIGAVAAATIFFILWYPNVSGLPLPNAIAQAYLGLLPTWNYDFQFAVNLDPAATGELYGLGTPLITGATATFSLAVMAAARLWRGGPVGEARESALGEGAAGRGG
ncbi:MAG: phospholipid carrier-dependent glycosyltransferase [Chloroflexota bacterium]|nr:phospholipid carrier-dependent glycosyltransferase [Chloroflexota bacterium]